MVLAGGQTVSSRRVGEEASLVKFIICTEFSDDDMVAPLTFLGSGGLD